MRGLGESEDPQIGAQPDEEKSVSELRHSEVGRAEHVGDGGVPQLRKAPNNLVSNLSAIKRCHPADILNYERRWRQLANDIEHREIQAVTRVVEVPRTRQGEPLARRSSNNDIWLQSPEMASKIRANRLCGEIRIKCLRAREVPSEGL